MVDDSAEGASVLSDEVNKPYFNELIEFVNHERETSTVYPPEEDLFKAFELCPYEQVRVVLLGQDPYHDEGQAHGLCFSVRPGVKPPPSLADGADLGVTAPIDTSGTLNADPEVQTP